MISFFQEFFLYILKSIWFLLPAYIANSTPVLVYKLPVLNVPVDFNRKLNGKPIFGTHKTWRGLVFGILFGMIITYLQAILYQNFEFIKKISIYDYENAFLFGFLMSFGALFGDLVKSFFKRRVGIREGKDWPIFDQIDFIVGALVFTLPYFEKSFIFIFSCFFISIVLHIFTNLYLKPLFMQEKNSKKAKIRYKKTYFVF
ncbi:MAG: CDP-2,3-bis-(O-geranylgeranyl)-sn-glycerol synthase [Candidatus Woesearchaeota archaeon]